MSKIFSVWDFIRKHKYLVVFLFFGIIVGFADSNSFWFRYKRLQEIAALKAEVQTYKNRFNEDSRQVEQLENNPEAVKRVAREQYLMKYDNEDVFVFMNEDEE